MTTDQALALMVNLSAAFPRAEIPEPTAELYIEHLVPLPYARTEAALRRLAVTHPYPTLPALADIRRVAVCEDPDSPAVAQYLEAIAAKRPLVRDAASATGWAVGQAILPPEEAARLQAEAAQRALPAGAVVGDEQRRTIKERMLALAKGLGGADW